LLLFHRGTDQPIVEHRLEEVVMRYRRFEPVDIAVVSGGLLTFFGATLLWVSTQGSFQIATPMESTADIDKKSLQEEIGKNVVAAAVIEAKHSKDISRVAQRLNAETITAERINDSGNESVQHLVKERQEQERSKAARIEFVKGQSIVNATVRAKRGQSIPDEQWKELNGRVIATAAHEGERIDRAFRINAPETFKTALENETKVHTAIWQRTQEEAGDAIVQASLVQQEYERASASVQEQIGSLVSRAAASHML
jgi:hypothetical protein